MRINLGIKRFNLNLILTRNIINTIGYRDCDFLPSNSKNYVKLKNFENIDCVVTNHNCCGITLFLDCIFLERAGIKDLP